MFLEIFRFVDRLTLEISQLVSRKWHRLVAANHSELALRRIQKLAIHYSESRVGQLFHLNFMLSKTKHEKAGPAVPTHSRLFAALTTPPEAVARKSLVVQVVFHGLERKIPYSVFRQFWQNRKKGVFSKPDL